MEYQTIYREMTVSPTDTGVDSELSTTIKLVNGFDGYFVEITQPEEGTIRIDHEDWPLVRDAIDKVVAGCKRLDSQRED